MLYHVLSLLMLTASATSQTRNAKSSNAKSPKKSEPLLFSFELDVPLNFGKTHFIVGYSPDASTKETRKKPEPVASDTPFNFICDGCIKQVFFSPDDSVQKALLHLIEQEQESIRIATFTFTDGDVAEALIAAKNRGIAIDIIADAGCVTGRFGKIPLLQEQGFNVFVYDPDYKKNNKKSFSASIMHNKFLIFGRNLLNKSIVWTGSFNITKSAHSQNQENVIVLDDAQVIQKYARQFEVLKERSHQPKKVRKAKQQQPELAVSSVISLSKRGTVFEDMEEARA